ncbi:MAG: FliG C-terminal domain-containing protein [Alphaproteobacteria bacterium]
MAQPMTPPRPAAPRVLSGPEKASVMMLTMGEQRSAKILPQLSEEELGILTRAMAGVGRVKAAMVENLIDDFSQRAVPPPAAQRPVETRETPTGANTSTIWDKLARVSPNILAGYLLNEHPQAAAVVMRKLPPDVAAKVIGQFSEDFAGEVVGRIVKAEPIRREVLAHLEETLQEDLGADIDGAATGPAHLKNIMAHMDKPVGQRFVGAVRSVDRDAARLVTSAAFSFDNLRDLNGRDVQKVFDGISPATVATALKGASDSARDFIISNMPPRAAKLLRQEIERAGPIKLRDVDAAQQTILERAKSLADRGDVVFPTRRAA